MEIKQKFLTGTLSTKCVYMKLLINKNLLTFVFLLTNVYSTGKDLEAADKTFQDSFLELTLNMASW